MIEKERGGREKVKRVEEKRLILNCPTIAPSFEEEEDGKGRMIAPIAKGDT